MNGDNVNVEKDKRVFRRGRPSRVHSKREACFACKKTTSLVLFECRCNHIFCGAHLLPEVHSCECLADMRAQSRQRNTDTLMRGKTSNAKVLVI
jgi:predicted nucleic acid binding AN1-type Zn finger protein